MLVVGAIVAAGVAWAAGLLVTGIGWSVGGMWAALRVAQVASGRRGAAVVGGASCCGRWLWEAEPASDEAHLLEFWRPLASHGSDRPIEEPCRGLNAPVVGIEFTIERERRLVPVVETNCWELRPCFSY
eukprot:COSAG01_NODE_17_length_39991_cov_30.596160_27_plen_129_part_00